VRHIKLHHSYVSNEQTLGVLLTVHNEHSVPNAVPWRHLSDTAEPRIQCSVTSCESHSRRRCISTDFSSSFFGFPLLLVIPSLHHPRKCTIVLIMQHGIISSVLQIWPIAWLVTDWGSYIRCSVSCFTFAYRPDRLWGPTSLLSNGYCGLFPWGYNGRDLKLTVHFRLVPRSRKRASIHPLPHSSSWYSA
jgi:hypothetical protein